MKTVDRRYDGLKRAAASTHDNHHTVSIRTNIDPHAKIVIVVDDDRRLRRMLARTVLNFSPDAVVFQAEHGQDALKKLAEVRIRYLRDPLLIVTDLDMPVMDGWTLIGELRRDYEQRGVRTGIPVLVMSGTSGEKGPFFYRKSVHDGKAGYTPLVAVAKEDCLRQEKYFASGMDGLTTWLRHFLTESGTSEHAGQVADKLRG
jgi:CheY-like chemotaxis protein